MVYCIVCKSTACTNISKVLKTGHKIVNGKQYKAGVCTPSKKEK